MVCLTNLFTRYPPMPPKLNRKRALFVLTKIDEILAWEQAERGGARHPIRRPGKYLCEVRAGQYWRLENLKSFDEFLERRFPESRRKAYYLMSIHEHLPPQVRTRTERGGMDEGVGVGETCAPGRAGLRLCNLVAQSTKNAKGAIPAGSGKGTDGQGRGTVRADLLQGVQEPDSGDRASHRDGGTDAGLGSSHVGYCLEMICADFLAGASLDQQNPDSLLFSTTRLFNFLSCDQQEALLANRHEAQS